jgi:hypothetical protein
MDDPPASSGQRADQPAARSGSAGAPAAAVLAAPGPQPVATATGAGHGGGPMLAAVVTSPGVAGAPTTVPDEQGVMYVPMVMQQQQPQPPQEVAGASQEHGVAVVNFKAFRRKGWAGLQQPATAAAVGQVVGLTSFAAEAYGLDTEAFLR